MAGVDDAGARHEEQEIAVEQLRRRILQVGRRQRRGPPRPAETRRKQRGSERAGKPDRIITGHGIGAGRGQDGAAGEIGEQEGDRSPDAHGGIAGAEAPDA